MGAVATVAASVGVLLGVRVAELYVSQFFSMAALVFNASPAGLDVYLGVGRLLTLLVSGGVVGFVATWGLGLPTRRPLLMLTIAWVGWTAVGSLAWALAPIARRYGNASAEALSWLPVVFFVCVSVVVVVTVRPREDG